MTISGRLLIFSALSLSIAAALALSGCGLLFTDTREPYSYRPETPMDVQAAADDPVVSGRACEYYLFYLFDWGNRGYSDVIKNALPDRAHHILYDIKFDESINSWLLGLYIRQCTTLKARVGKI
ncbi:MAG: hypothetical protein ACYCPQ_06330 [Elusimicrobiota bacterium]